MYSFQILYKLPYICFFLLSVLFIPTLSSALEFTADDIQITGYDPASRYIGFVLTEERGGGNEIWWVVEPATHKAVHCYDLRRMSLEEGGMQAVYRARAEQRFADMRLSAGTDARSSRDRAELALPNGRLHIEEGKGGFAFTIYYISHDGKRTEVYTEDLTNMRNELGQPPGYYFGGGKFSPNGNWLAMVLDYENGVQSYLPLKKLVLLDLSTLER